VVVDQVVQENSRRHMRTTATAKESERIQDGRIESSSTPLSENLMKTGQPKAQNSFFVAASKPLQTPNKLRNSTDQLVQHWNNPVRRI